MGSIRGNSAVTILNSITDWVTTLVNKASRSLYLLAEVWVVVMGPGMVTGTYLSITHFDCEVD